MSSTISTGNDPLDELIGIRISAVMLILLGCLSGLYTVLFGVAVSKSAMNMWRGQLSPVDPPSTLIKMMFVVVICAGLTYSCFRAASALRQGRRWAASLAIALGALSLIFCGNIWYDMFYPHRETPDEYFGIIALPFLLFFGFWWCIYLNLPHVRAHMKAIKEAKTISVSEHDGS